MQRRSLYALLSLLFTLIVLAGCADSTLPEPVEAGTAGPSSYVMEPIVVRVPGGCDPYTDINFCEGGGGACITSALEPSDPDMNYTSTCPGGGGGGSGSGDDGGGDGDGGGGGGGGGSPTPTVPCPDYGCPTEPAECDPQYDPDCNQPLTSADSSTIRTAIQRHQRPASEFTDPAKAQQCSEMMTEFDRLYAAGKVFRGGSDTQSGDPLTETHVGAYDPVAGTIHFEPSALDAANTGDAAAVRSIFNTALHESAHSLGYVHTSPLWSGNYDLYMEAPFDLLSPGVNSCIKS